MEENVIVMDTMDTEVNEDLIPESTETNVQPIDEIDVVDVTPVENGNDDLIGKAVLLAGTVAAGAAVVYWKKHKDEIKAKHAQKVKDREQKKIAKASKKITKANEILSVGEIESEIVTCDCVEQPSAT